MKSKHPLVIEVKKISKNYKVFSRRYHRILEKFTSFKLHKKKEVLKNISFSVHRGRCLGILGLNGSGKSTLLKILSGTAIQNSGTFKINGSFSSILELGMGFHPDYSGRENIYRGLSLRGYPRKDIDRFEDDIIEFSELQEYIDQPLRFYSSGMHARLAFSVAIANKPELLILDEALSVGDAYFQQKCFKLIKQLKKEGTSIIFVSHNINDVKALCDEAILLSGGKILASGSPEKVSDIYNQLLTKFVKIDDVQQVNIINQNKILIRSGSKEAEIFDVLIKNANNNKSNKLFISGIDNINLYAKVKINKNIDNLVFGTRIVDKYGLTVWGINSEKIKKIKSPQEGEIYEFFFKIECALSEGLYSFSVAIHDDKSHINKNYDWIDNVIFFKVQKNPNNEFTGIVGLKNVLTIKKKVKSKHGK